MEVDDLYCNTGEYIYLKFAGRYYRRKAGVGWSLLDPTTVPALTWSKLHEKQREAYTGALRDAKLID